MYLLPRGAGRAAGLPDFTCSVAPHGQTVRLKCKAGTGRQPEAQRTFQQTAVLVGTCCLVIRFMNNVMRVLPPPTNDNQP